MKNKQLPIFIALAAILFVFAYNMGQSLFGGAGTSAPVAARPAWFSNEDQQLSTKLQAYISCTNRVDSALRPIYSTYREDFADHLAEVAGSARNSRASMDRGAARALLKRRFDMGGFKVALAETNNEMVRECIDALRKAVAQSPADGDLNRTGTIYADTLEKLIPPMNAVSVYYEQGDYKDDHMAKGKTLDAEMAPLFDVLFKASSEMREQIRTRNAMLDEHKLAGMEKAGGRNFDWHLQNMMMQSRRTVDAIMAALNSDVPPLSAVQTAEGALQTAYDEAKAYSDAHHDTKDRLGNEPVLLRLYYLLDPLLKDVKDARRDLAGMTGDKAKMDRSKLQADARNLIDSYNELVQRYNQMMN